MEIEKSQEIYGKDQETCGKDCPFNCNSREKKTGYYGALKKVQFLNSKGCQNCKHLREYMRWISRGVNMDKEKSQVAQWEICIICGSRYKAEIGTVAVCAHCLGVNKPIQERKIQNDQKK